MELVDTLVPPAFIPSGIVKSLDDAVADGDWLGAFNLWIIRGTPDKPEIIYQQRSPLSTWGSNLLDVTVGGYYKAGELLLDGLREVKEELGITYPKKALTYIGRKINVSPDVNNYIRNTVVDTYFVKDERPIHKFTLQKEEVYAICVCPVNELLKVHTDEKYSFIAEGLDTDGKAIRIKVSKQSFPYNWDNYHYKIALLAQRYLKGEKPLIY